MNQTQSSTSGARDAELASSSSLTLVRAVHQDHDDDDDDDDVVARTGRPGRLLAAPRTTEPDTTSTGSGTGAWRSGQRSPDDVIGSPGPTTASYKHTITPVYTAQLALITCLQRVTSTRPSPTHVIQPTPSQRRAVSLRQL